MNVLLLGANHRAAIELNTLLSETRLTLESIILPSLENSLSTELLDQISAASADVVAFTPEIPLSRLSFRRRLHLVDVVKKICTAVSQKNCTFVHLSSALVFDGRQQQAYTEEDKPNPSSDLAKVWRRWETIVQGQFSNHIVLRPSWLLGADESYISSEIKQALGFHAAPDRVVDAIGNPVAPGELARVIAAVIRQIETGASNYGVFHIASKESLSSARVLERIAPESYLRIDDKNGHFNFELNCQKILNNFGVQRRAWY